MAGNASGEAGDAARGSVRIGALRDPSGPEKPDRDSGAETPASALITRAKGRAARGKRTEAFEREILTRGRQGQNRAHGGAIDADRREGSAGHDVGRPAPRWRA
jgi:plasmid stability protein